jgi:hypothetical protein
MPGIRTCGCVGKFSSGSPGREALIAEYGAGARVCELAKFYHLHRTMVARHVARVGITRPVMTEAQIDEAVVLFATTQRRQRTGLRAR